MHNNFVAGSGNNEKTRQPISGVKHFWLSFLAVVTGVPVSMIFVSVGLSIVGFIFILMVSLAFGSSAPSNELMMNQVYGDVSSSNTLVSVPIRGVILSGSAADPLQSIFGQSYADGEQIKEQLRTLADDSSVDGIILEIDSPGGMITASKAIADGIDYYREKTGNPIISHINGVGASGAYWAASSTDEIYAEQGSEAGSIGAIMGPLVTLTGVMSYGDVSTNQPIGFKYYTAGRSKDLGSPFRPVTAEEDTFLNQQLQLEYEKFVTHVSKGRGIASETIKGEIGALGYGTDDSMRLKLIDRVMSKEDAYDELAKKAGVTNNFKLMRIDNSADFFGSLFGAKKFISSMHMSGADKSAARTRFCETNLLDRPLVFAGDLQSVCK